MVHGLDGNSKNSTDFLLLLWLNEFNTRLIWKIAAEITDFPLQVRAPISELPSYLVVSWRVMKKYQNHISISARFGEIVQFRYLINI